MANLNKVYLLGNLTRDPELRYTSSGNAVTSFGLAVNKNYTTKSGEKKQDTCFVKIVVFGKQAESCSKYLSKGRLVLVQGRLQYRSWESDGKKKSSLDVVGERVQFMPVGGRGRTDESASGTSKDEEKEIFLEEEGKEENDENEEVPF